MTGKVNFAIKNSRITYKFQLERNVTIITGDSGTGKTKLFNMVKAYEEYGKVGSGISLRCSNPCVTLTNKSDWYYKLSNTRESIVFIDEASDFLRTHEFAEAIIHSDNYYVIITREALPQIPYSIDSIKGIVKNGASSSIEKMYTNVSLKDITKHKYDVIITEDSESGFQLYEIVAGRVNSLCISAYGKSNLLDVIKSKEGMSVLVVADAAALGPEIKELLKYKELTTGVVEFFLPESFEWLILKSGIISSRNIDESLKSPINKIDSSKYFSWEKYFVDLLKQETKELPGLKYSKKKLAKGYKSDANIDKIIGAMKNNKQSK